MKIVLTYIFVLVFYFLNAQDIHFSQYFYSPLTLNPANAGNFDGDWRIANNYRNQWKALSIPFRTIGVSYEHQFYIFSEQFSYGINIVNDKSGPAGLTVNKLFGTIAYHKKIESHNLHFGIQGGMIFKNFSLDQLTFPSQFDMTTGYFNNQLNNNETNLISNINYPDLNIGFLWQKQMRRIQTEIGVAAFHLIMPKESFNDDNNKLPIRYTIYGGIYYPVKSFYVKPQVFEMRQNKATDLLLGLELGFNLTHAPIKLKRIFAGYFTRNDFNTAFDASIFMIGFQIKQLQLAFSYDINTSPLSVATNKRGAYEFSLIFTSKSTIPQKITLPCDRM